VRFPTRSNAVPGPRASCCAGCPHSRGASVSRRSFGAGMKGVRGEEARRGYSAWCGDRTRFFGDPRRTGRGSSKHRLSCRTERAKPVFTNRRHQHDAAAWFARPAPAELLVERVSGSPSSCATPRCAFPGEHPRRIVAGICRRLVPNSTALDDFDEFPSGPVPPLFRVVPGGYSQGDSPIGLPRPAGGCGLWWAPRRDLCRTGGRNDVNRPAGTSDRADGVLPASAAEALDGVEASTFLVHKRRAVFRSVTTAGACPR